LPTTKRAKRPELDRVSPIRDFSRIFGPAAPGETPRAKRPGEPRAGRPADIGKAVTAGYQVIDEYMRQGEEFARTMYGSAAGESSPLFPFSPPRGSSGGDAQEMAGRLFQVAADFAGAWMDLMQTTTGRGGQRPGSEPRPDVPGFDINAPPSSAPAPAADPEVARAEQRAPLTLQIDSKQRVEVAVDVRSDPAGGPIVAHDLRAIDPALPRIEKVQIERTSGEGLVIRLRISDKQPPGVYSGVVVDERTNLPRGTISVRVIGKEARVGPGL
jgi:hypothetical protein